MANYPIVIVNYSIAMANYPIAMASYPIKAILGLLPRSKLYKTGIKPYYKNITYYLLLDILWYT